ncbi:putative transcriptional regulator [Mycobacteroides abscessus]|nr:putative transcriptional regulator [Mycobacteroides abscessus]SKK65732.1 putative transcriptional regulator [Mycobacteroides abscessus subsp. massiliense]SKV96311.1 putative transcriptional regulator [Mycobacteroides abscessus subsp. massiliense]
MKGCSEFAIDTLDRRLCATSAARKQVRMSDDDDPAVLERLGAKIKARREKLGLAQGVLAERAKIHRTYVNQVENGRRNITVGLLARISAALGTTPAALTKGILSEATEESDQ